MEKNTKTKWEILTFYENQGTVFAVLCRKNVKTGMLYFKCKGVNKSNLPLYTYPSVNINKQFEKIMAK